MVRNKDGGIILSQHLSKNPSASDTVNVTNKIGCRFLFGSDIISKLFNIETIMKPSQGPKKWLYLQSLFAICVAKS
jgi:hypothetical protein